RADRTPPPAALPARRHDPGPPRGDRPRRAAVLPLPHPEGRGGRQSDPALDRGTRRRRGDRRRAGRRLRRGTGMNTRRRTACLGTVAGVGALAVLCCAAVPAVLGAATGAAIGGVPGVIAAAVFALIVALALYRRRAARGSRC